MRLGGKVCCLKNTTHQGIKTEPKTKMGGKEDFNDNHMVMPSTNTGCSTNRTSLNYTSKLFTWWGGIQVWDCKHILLDRNFKHMC